jgi:hypothetical protein
LSIPIQANVLHGGIGFNHSEALFILPINNVSLYHYPTAGSASPFDDEDDEPIAEDGSFLKCKMPTDRHPYYRQLVQPSPDPQGAQGSKATKVGKPPAVQVRPFPLINYFPTPVLVHKLTLVSCGNVLELEPVNRAFFEKPCESLQTWPMIYLRFNRQHAMTILAENSAFVPFTCYMEIHTNVSIHHIPLQVVDIAIKIPFLDSVSWSLSTLVLLNNLIVDVICSKYWILECCMNSGTPSLPSQISRSLE